MSIYIYAILSSTPNNLDLPQGIKRQVELAVYENIVAVIEKDISIKDLQATEDVLLKTVISHDRVMQNIFSQVPLIPLRFGTIFLSITSLVTHLKNNQSRYIEELKKVTQKVEYTIKFIPAVYQSDNFKNVQITGKNYLLAKKKSYQLQQKFILEQQSQWQKIKQTIFQNFLDNSILDEEQEIKKIFLLVDRNININNLTDMWKQLCCHWEIIITEPLPCYHFTNIQIIDGN